MFGFGEGRALVVWGGRLPAACASALFLLPAPANALLPAKKAQRNSPPPKAHTSPRRPSHAATSAGSRSDSRRAIKPWHSGSPKRTLCSKSLARPALTISPAKSTPRNGAPSATIARAVGSTISSMTCSFLC